jgi:hypothetical protein
MAMTCPFAPRALPRFIIVPTSSDSPRRGSNKRLFAAAHASAIVQVFGRRPQERVDRSVKPASENLHRSGNANYSIARLGSCSSCLARFSCDASGYVEHADSYSGIDEKMDIFCGRLGKSRRLTPAGNFRSTRRTGSRRRGCVIVETSGCCLRP